MGSIFTRDLISLTFRCGICVDRISYREYFAARGCSHSYCSDCVCEYLTSKIQDDIALIACPFRGCSGSLDPQHCRSILAPQLFAKWRESCETLISECDKFYLRKSPVSSSFTCDICTDTKPSKKSFAIKGCNHTYCSDCIRQYVNSKIEDGVIRISCPVSRCYRSLKPEHCRSILPSKVFNKWQDKLREAAIPVRNRFYCPYKTCSALTAKDPNFKDIVKMKCHSCHKLICTECNVPWHRGFTCQEFQALHQDEREKEALMLKELAKKNGWTRCPQCKFYVEKIEGCSHIRCRCKNDFCYSCGAQLGIVSHICPKAPR